MPAFVYSLLTVLDLRASLTDAGARQTRTQPVTRAPAREPTRTPYGGMPAPSVVRAETVPAIELDGLGGQLHHALLRQPGEDGVERLLLADAGVEGLVAAEA